MNRLKLLKFYCCGPIDRASDRGAPWREDISNWLISRNAIPLNPLKKPIDVGLEDDDNHGLRQIARSKNNYQLLREQMKIIRNVDLRMVDSCDCLIANLDFNFKPCGTWEELFLANNQKKPIIIHCPQGIEAIPDWLFGTVPYQLFFDTWDGVKNYLDHVDKDIVVDELNRWRFFDLEEIVAKISKNIFDSSH